MKFDFNVREKIVGIWQKLAHNLTTWENHAYEDNFEKSLTLKMFTINALVACKSDFLYFGYAYCISKKIA